MKRDHANRDDRVRQHTPYSAFRRYETERAVGILERRLEEEHRALERLWGFRCRAQDALTPAAVGA